MTKALSLAIAAGLLTAICVATAQADTFHFKDVLWPNGVERGMKRKFFDAHVCGTIGNTFKHVTAFKNCMSDRGWVVDNDTPDPQPRYAARAEFGSNVCIGDCGGPGVSADIPSASTMATVPDPMTSNPAMDAYYNQQQDLIQQCENSFIPAQQQ